MLIFSCTISFLGCSQKKETHTQLNTTMNTEKSTDSTAIATFGAGCFWCVEACFTELEGVNKVESGYMGGKIKNPTYKEVCSGITGHAEVAQITYNPEEITYEELLEVFWFVHDPTTLNRQGNDVGTQYRSVVFYHNEEQKNLAEHYKSKLNKSGVYDSQVVTEISAAETFYVAEEYHQNYYNTNPNQPYCAAVVRPKVDKFKKVFADKLQK